ncbi:MAG TPA: glycosyltransferase family 2 protein, partial [Blastocatellia bacterium]
MSDNSLVSVIIIFLNAEEFIAEAIESVFDQTYSDWELLLVDDGSTDASAEIALRYAAGYRGRVRYLEHEGHQNRGMSASRNLGIASARGEFVAFLDADDVW